MTKTEQKYKGTRRIERRLILPIKNQIAPFPIYVHISKEMYKNSWIGAVYNPRYCGWYL